METTSQETPDLETILHDANAFTDRIIAIRNEVDGALVFDSDELRLINATGEAIGALETAEQILFAAISDDAFPVSNLGIKQSTLAMIETELRQAITPEMREACLNVLAALVRVRGKLADRIDPTQD